MPVNLAVIRQNFFIDSQIFSAIPGLRVFVAVANNIAPSIMIEHETRKLLRATWQEGATACALYQNVQSHPQVNAWRECFRSLGIPSKKYVSSIESLLKRASKQPEPRSINPIVDLYNAVSLRYLLPFGAFDLDELPIESPLELRLTRQDDVFMALDESEHHPVSAGEVAYVTGTEVLTRHINWKQSKMGLIKSGTVNAIFMSEILSSMPPIVIDKMVDDLTHWLRNVLHASCTMKIVDASDPSFAY